MRLVSATNYGRNKLKFRLMQKIFCSINMFRNHKIVVVLILVMFFAWLSFLYNLQQNPLQAFERPGSIFAHQYIPPVSVVKEAATTTEKSSNNISQEALKEFNDSLPTFEAVNYLTILKPLFFTGSNREAEQTTSEVAKSKRNHSSEASEKNKLILFYTRYRGNAFWMDEHMTKDGIMYGLNTYTHNCPFNCTFTHEKSLAERSHAVIFSIVDNFYFPEVPQFPSSRSPDQVWIAYASTVAANVDKFNSKFDEMDSIYNWTASYRLDSDIYWPYGYFYTLPVNTTSVTPTAHNATRETSSELFKDKKLIASMISSKCTTKSFREGIISELQTYISVDIYGACGSHKCPHTLEDRDPCLKHIGNQYKFYLAFENALCEDYITDEFFAAFEHGMVPVTYGLGDYTQVAPHRSYINMLDFPSIKHLAKYLVHLSKNEREYQKYFEWKKEYGIQVHLKYSVLCGLCYKLWELETNMKSPKVCKSFREWWNRKRSADWGKDYFRKWFLSSDNEDAACKYFVE